MSKSELQFTLPRSADESSKRCLTLIAEMGSESFDLCLLDDSENVSIDTAEKRVRAALARSTKEVDKAFAAIRKEMAQHEGCTFKVTVEHHRHGEYTVYVEARRREVPEERDRRVAAFQSEEKEREEHRRRTADNSLRTAIRILGRQGAAEALARLNASE